jgi:hypothetical protein
MLSAETLLVSHAAELARLHAAELPQKDELCGAFQTLLALRLAGVEPPDGSPLDQDAVAQAAGGVLAPTIHDEVLPAGQRGRRDYRLELPVGEDDASAGTSPAGLVRAVDELSGGSQAAVPVAGPWTAERVTQLLQAATSEPQAALVLNVATRFLWGSHPAPADVVAYLETGDDAGGPQPDWDVGHYVGCLGAVRGPRGVMAIIADTYPVLGHGAVYLQPRERLAAALRREGMAPGGALVVLPAERAGALRAGLAGAGFRLETWDNGSPDVRSG